MDGAATFKPADGLDVHETEDGLIVFNPATDRVHHLNHTAGAVFVLCDGAKGVEELAAEVKRLFELSDAPTEEVRSALDQLVDEGVLLPSTSEGA